MQHERSKRKRAALFAVEINICVFFMLGDVENPMVVIYWTDRNSYVYSYLKI